MPKVFEWQGYKFFFFSNEGEPLEPCHIHVRKGESTAKFWIIPNISLSRSYKINAAQLKKIEKVILERKAEIEEKWNEYFNH